ncbi:MAG: ribosome maturation factor RimP [Gemmatimonadota bacterium]|nr:ribosome maturation factor RimP [Gemmatimonadota bacterium]
MKQTLEPIVIAALESLGLDLVELRVGGTRQRPLLDVRVDRRDLQKVTVDDCAGASRAIEARLDADPALFGDRYVLEVSSPGMERPLRTESDWRRFTGRKANVKSTRLGGRAEVEIVGVEDEAGVTRLRLRDAKGNEHLLGLAEVDEARLAFHWKP